MERKEPPSDSDIKLTFVRILDDAQASGVDVEKVMRIWEHAKDAQAAWEGRDRIKVERRKEPPSTEEVIKWIESRTGQPLPPYIKEQMMRGRIPTQEEHLNAILRKPNQRRKKPD